MLRKVLVLLVACSLVPIVASPALGAGDWDPNDVPGHYDLRWVGAKWLDGSRMQVIIGFYPGFDRHGIDGLAVLARFFVSNDPTVGWNSGGLWRNPRHRLVWVYGDMGSGCCWKHGVTWLTPTTFRVRFDTHSSDRSVLAVRGLTSARVAGKPVRDWTGRIPL
jgi:hypothetical protein